MTDRERRTFTRIRVEVQIEVANAEEIFGGNGIRDISLGGAFVLTDRLLPVGTSCIMTINLVGPSSFLTVELEGEVLRTEEMGVGIEFTSIDLDSLVHLRHLIKVHTECPSVIDEEFVYKLIRLEDTEPRKE